MLGLIIVWIPISALYNCRYVKFRLFSVMSYTFIAAIKTTVWIL